jgi:hypothetical protein
VVHNYRGSWIVLASDLSLRAVIVRFEAGLGAIAAKAPLFRNIGIVVRCIED